MIDCVAVVPDLPSWKLETVEAKFKVKKFQPAETAV